MNRYVKGAIVFTGGVAVGLVIGTVRTYGKMLCDEDVRHVIVKKTSDKIETLLWGEAPKRRNNSRVSYRNYYESRSGSMKYRFVNLYFNTREDAENVLDELRGLCDKYGLVTVADLHNLPSVPTNHVSNRYGWTNIDGVEVCIDSGNYFINLPDPVKLY